jgi:soluble lytic murein transglycosylase-like protein
MDVVKRLAPRVIFGLLCSLSAAVSAAPTPVFCGTKHWQGFIDEAAARFNLPAHYLHAVIAAESAGCESINGRPTTSLVGAMGVMQLMPATWERFRRAFNLGTDAYDPHDNILAGAAYLHELVDRYGWPGAAAAYHAGPARYDDYLTVGRALPQATLDYLARIDRTLARLSTESGQIATTSASPTDANREIFVGHKPADGDIAVESDHTLSGGLFVELRHSKRQRERKPPESSDVQQK